MSKKLAWALGTTGALGTLFFVFLGFYSIQPIGAVTDGATAIVWRESGEQYARARTCYVALEAAALTSSHMPAGYEMAPGTEAALGTLAGQYVQIAKSAGAKLNMSKNDVDRDLDDAQRAYSRSYRGVSTDITRAKLFKLGSTVERCSKTDPR